MKVAKFFDDFVLDRSEDVLHVKANVETEVFVVLPYHYYNDGGAENETVTADVDCDNRVSSLKEINGGFKFNILLDVDETAFCNFDVVYDFTPPNGVSRKKQHNVALLVSTKMTLEEYVDSLVVEDSVKE